jgi:arylsulfatase A-like enzyme
MPNLSRLADRAVVYHNHYAASSFTSPGTASLLTGVMPWTHRALESKGTVADRFITDNIFSAFKDHYRIAYTHNGWANILLEQFKADLDELVPWKSLFLNSLDSFIPALFGRDSDIATVGWTRTIDVATEGYSYSLLISRLYNALLEYKYASLKKSFPRGLPSTGNVGSEFLLEEGIDWVAKRLPQIPQPFMGYFHFLPPHGPYNTTLKYYDHFAGDGFRPLEKPEDVFSRHVPEAALQKKRREYDEFILYVDEEFGRFFDNLESSGILENTWVFLTSDHGEMNERGISGHSTDALFQPVVRVPLMVFEPGRTERLDVRTPTSAVDILPTALSLAGQPAADWSEGAVLPPFAQVTPALERSIYAVKGDKNEKYAPLEHASTMLVRGKYKLMYSYGLKNTSEGDLVRLFDIEADPEEMNELQISQKDVAEDLLRELKAKLEEVNRPYL